MKTCISTSRIKVLLFSVLFCAVTGDAMASSERDIFSVNFIAYGRQHEGDLWMDESIRQTVKLTSGDVAGAEGFATDGWQNVPVARESSALRSTQGSGANLQILRYRNGSSFYSGRARNPETFEVPNATLLDAKMRGTYDPGDGSLHTVFAITEIPFAAYDLVVYLSASEALRGNGRGTLRINEGHERAFTLPANEPDGTMEEITDSVTPGNYMVVRGLSGATLHLDMRGDGFNHLGVAGFQIMEADRARPPLEITDMRYDPSTQQAMLTWRSFPGDQYGIYWVDEDEGLPVFIDPMVAAHPEAKVTTYGPFDSPVRHPDRDTFRVGQPDPYRPVIERVWGNNRKVSLAFSKPMAREAALDPSNYMVTKQGGDQVAIDSVRFYPGRDTVLLTTDAALALNATYTVAVHNLVDLAGYALEGDRVLSFRTWDDNPDGVQVFILSGQSNMVGRGSRENGHGGVAGGIGSLRYMAVTDPERFGRLLVDPDDPENSPWLDREDVRMWWSRADIGANPNPLKGYIGPDTTPTTFGPEYGFGWAVGDHFEQPVLLVKSCWGGKSLFRDFRSPRAVASRGGEVGPYYMELIAQVRYVLDNLETAFPAFAGMGYQIAGFGWHQGWNDSLNEPHAAEYEANMVDFIRDIRDAFGQPDLPISIGATGHGGFDQTPNRATVLAAQLAVADPQRHPAFAGTVFTADTRPFWREVSVSPRDDGSHWNHNGESFFLIGYSMGRGMVQMLER